MQGCLEIRLITERKKESPKEKTELVRRRFYADAGAVLADLDELRRVAADRRAGVFYGVLPRLEKGKGKAADIAPGRTVWADIDFKDFKGGEAEARAMVAAFAYPPSIVVRTGHGVHLYWILAETLPAAELSAISKLLARALHGDHAFDASRILRLPGTYNRKDLNNITVATVELLDETRV